MDTAIHLLEWLQFSPDTAKCRQDVEQQEPLNTDENAKCLLLCSLKVCSEIRSIHLPSYLSILTPRYLPKKNENLYFHKNLYMNIYNRFIRNCPELKTT